MPDPVVCFGLIVTGKGEGEFLPTLLSSLGHTGAAEFIVIARTGQRTPVTSPMRRLLMVGKGITIPNKDQDQIGLPARGFLEESDKHCVILIDDLEQASLNHATEKFQRYQSAIETMVKHKPDLNKRAAVYFLVNMLEAYYFADAQAIQNHFRLPQPINDFEGDVETIGHPKGELDALCKQNMNRGFKEIEDGWAIIRCLNIEHVLSKPETCAWLRTLFAWCIEKIVQIHFGLELTQENVNLVQEVERDIDHMMKSFCLENGRYADIPRTQLSYFSHAANLEGKR